MTDDRTGLDAQVSNWWDDTSGLRYLDVTTRSPSCWVALGMGARRSSSRRLPLGAREQHRRPDRRGSWPSYTDGACCSTYAANLIKERLEHWIHEVLAAANKHVRPS
ncbi:MAG: hypothetical protein R2716_14150 [Microthrixaceae bacterium]